MSTIHTNPPPQQPNNSIFNQAEEKKEPTEQKTNPQVLQKIQAGMPISAEELELSEDATDKSNRETNPTTLYVGLGFPEGIHIGINHNITDKWAVGGSVGTMGIVNDYNVHGRYYFAGGKEWSGYTQTGAHVIQNNLVDAIGGREFTAAISQSVGVEFRGDSGMTYNLSAGAAVNQQGAWIPVAQATVGYSF